VELAVYSPCRLLSALLPFAGTVSGPHQSLRLSQRVRRKACEHPKNQLPQQELPPGQTTFFNCSYRHTTDTIKERNATLYTSLNSLHCCRLVKQHQEALDITPPCYPGYPRRDHLPCICHTFAVKYTRHIGSTYLSWPAPGYLLRNNPLRHQIHNHSLNIAYTSGWRH